MPESDTDTPSDPGSAVSSVADDARPAASGPTLDDARLMVSLAQLGADMDMAAANSFLYGPDFPVEYGDFTARFRWDSTEHALVAGLLEWLETVATLVRNGLFDASLCADWLTVAPAWDRLRFVAQARRYESGDPSLFANLEWLAEQHRSGAHRVR